MKINELEVYKALKILTESGYLVKESMLTENRTFDVEELVIKYKERIMTLLKQRITQMLDKVYDGQEVDKTITIEIPALMVPVTYRPEPVRMKALTVKLYGDKKDVKSDYDAQKGRGKGTLYANAMGDTNPDTDPVVLMINLPNVIATEETKTSAKTTKMTEGKYTSRLSNQIPFPETRAQQEKPQNQKQVDDILTRLYRGNVDMSKVAPKKKKTATRPAQGRTPERDALYARFANRYGGSAGYYGGYSSYTYQAPDDSFKFKKAVEEAEKEAQTPQEVVNAIMNKYFNGFFKEVLHHELTHFIQANNKQLDGTEDAHEYDAHKVVATGAYASDELEYEAKLHQKLPNYIAAIQKSVNVTPIAKKLVTHLFSNKFKELPKDKQHRYFNEILTLCQVLKSHPEITKYNYNTAKIKKLLRDSL